MASQTAMNTHIRINTESVLVPTCSPSEPDLQTFKDICAGHSDDNHKTREEDISITHETDEIWINSNGACTDMSCNSTISTLQTDDPVTPKTEIKQKLVFLFMFIPAMLLSIYCLRHSESAKYKIIAAAIFWISVIFYTNWLYFIFKSSKLHRIEVITAKLKPDYGNMIFPLQIKQYPFKPAFSVSELFAIRGSSVHLLSCVASISTGTLISLAVTIHWMDQYQHGVDIVHDHEAGYWQFLAICGCIGLPIIGNFDLNSRSTGHVIMHYIGVIMMGLSVFPFGMQQNWSLMSVTLIVAGFGALTVWRIMIYLFPKDLEDQVDDGMMREEDVFKKVHKLSVICILMETIGCIIIALINTMFIWNLQNVVLRKLNVLDFSVLCESC